MSEHYPFSRLNECDKDHILPERRTVPGLPGCYEPIDEAAQLDIAASQHSGSRKIRFVIDGDDWEVIFDPA